jgi:bifunctional ADP-heptose synthase (sugar kinase/adenylyltransferase)
VPVVLVSKEDERLGGAANVARNAASVGAQISILGVVGDVAIKSLAKSAIDDVTTGVGKVVSDRSKTYIDWYKQGVMTYDDVLAKISEDLSDIMVKSSDELSSLKNAINEYPQSVVPEKLETFTEYMVRSLKERGG